MILTLTRILFVADIIELGVPFTDPIADGPTIQTANTVCQPERNTPISVFMFHKQANRIRWPLNMAFPSRQHFPW